MTQEAEQFKAAWAKIIARAWKDQTFKQRLLKDPMAVMKEYKINMAENAKVLVHENMNKTYHLTLPEMPANISKSLSEEELRKIAAAAGGTNHCKLE